MAKIPFDINKRPEIESGEYKVETRDGRPVRIICWDLNDRKYVIVAAVQNKDGTNDVISYADNGSFLLGMENESDLIIIAPEPELTEFEKAVEAIYDSCNVKELAFKKKTAELLELARKDIEKDLPRWKKCAPCDEDKATIPAWIVRFDAELAGESAVVHNGHYILFGDLEKLPKEE